MFNTYHVNTSPDHSPALRQLVRSYDGLSSTIRDTSETEIKSKDRVDITLEEYLSMRKKIEELERSNRHMESIFKRMGEEAAFILSDSSIPVEDIKVEHAIDPEWFKHHYRILFTVNDNDLRKRGI